MRAQNNTLLNNTQHKFSTSHVFDVNLACQYGIDESILIHHFCFWISFNKRMNKNFIGGKTWMYQTQKEMAAYHPYWTVRHIMRIIQSLINQGVLVSGNHSKNKFEKTTWYAFASEELFMFTPVSSIEDPKTDLRMSETVSSYIGKDTEREDTEKQQHEDPKKNESSHPKRPAIAAASSAKKKPSAKAKPAGKKEIDPLKEVPIPDSDKQWLENTFNLPTIEAAVSWATHPTTKLKKTLAAAIKWFCGLEAKSRPKIPEQENDKANTNRQLAKQIERQVTHPNGYEFIANNKICYVDKGSYLKPIEIQYNTPNFKEHLYAVLKEHGFKRRV